MSRLNRTAVMKRKSSAVESDVYVFQEGDTNSETANPLRQKKRAATNPPPKRTRHEEKEAAKRQQEEDQHQLDLEEEAQHRLDREEEEQRNADPPSEEGYASFDEDVKGNTTLPNGMQPPASKVSQPTSAPAAKAEDLYYQLVVNYPDLAELGFEDFLDTPEEDLKNEFTRLGMKLVDIVKFRKLRAPQVYVTL